jgi:DNA-binding transcriptional LysR family regulator
VQQRLKVIPLHLIETFVVYADNQNLAKTAKILGQTQPSASRQIIQFQGYFKKALFHQKGQSKKLSSYGEEVCKYYRDGIVNLRELRTRFDNMTVQDQKNILTLAARPEILQKHIVKLNFKSSIELINMNGSQIQESLKSGALDMAVLHENFESYDYFRKKLFSSSWSVIGPRTWKVDNKAISNSATNLEKWLDASPLHPFASYDKQSDFLLQNKLKSFQLPRLNTQFIANDWRLLADKVAQQKCWAIVPGDYSENAHYISLSLAQKMKDTQFYLYFKKDLAKNEDIHYVIDQLS